MQITIRNYRAIEDAELALEKIALVGGMNEAGKTSIAQAVAAALTRDPMPLPELNKSETGLLLRDGQKRGNCTIESAGGTVSVSWPGGSVKDDGGPIASPIACGLVNLAELKPADAARLLIAAIGADPSFDEFCNAMAFADLGIGVTEAVWAKIVAEGWDAALKHAKTKSPTLKGAWSQITGKNYGANTAAAWVAVDYQEGADATELQAAADAAAETFENAIASQAVSADKIERMKAQQTEGNEAEAKHAELNATAEALSKKILDLAEKLAALPRPETAETLAECPHCSEKIIVISATELAKPKSKITKRENDARQQAIAIKQTELANARQTYQSHCVELAKLAQTVRDGVMAGKKLGKIPDGGVTEEQTQAAGVALELARSRVAALKQTTEAFAKHEQIIANGAIIDILAPNGLRQAVLAHRLEELNERMLELTKVADWPTVKIEDDLRITGDGRPYVLLSKSAQFRVHTVLQIVIAQIDASEAVIIDAADILDRAGRNGLFTLLHTAGVKALVTMTLNAKADVPNLAAAGMGRSYWLAEASLWPIKGIA